ncbi:MAG: DUF4834 family protein [Bacteroidales bacterium]|jgi:hypothetical protein|nr:DUF4834 family protein [Bacteroidales bacterium]
MWLKVLLFVGAIYLFFKFLGFKMRKYMGFYDAPQQKRTAPPRREGDVRVESTRTQQSQINPNEGEYVDFEEID